MYENLYKISKVILLLVILDIVNVMSAGIFIFVCIHIISNFIEEDYVYNKQIFKKLSIDAICTEIFLGLVCRVIIFVFINVPLVYSSELSQIIRGLNIFTFIQIFFMTTYIFKYMFYNDLRVTHAIRASLICANYKIIVSILVIVGVSGFIMIMTVIGKGSFPLLIMISIFMWQLLASYSFKSIMIAEERKEAL